MSALESRPPYFSLSYAPLSPAPGSQSSEHRNARVTVFFNDLSQAVAKRIAADATTTIGFIGSQMPPNSDWRRLTGEALSVAQVLVPLYAQAYLHRPWALGELALFRSRLATVGCPHVDRHLQPVLWAPVFSSPTPELDRAMALGADFPAYARLGLRALGLEEDHYEAYAAIVDRVASRVVEASENCPLAASPANPLPMRLDPLGAATFVVAVATRPHAATARRPAPHTAGGTGWRPFPDRDSLPIADVAANFADRLGLSARTADFVVDPAVFDGLPGVLLIDPAVADAEPDRAILVDALTSLPNWVVPLVVIGPAARGTRQRARLEDSLDRLQAANQRTQRATGLAELADVLPMAIASACAQRNPVARFQRGPSGRPRLAP